MYIVISSFKDLTDNEFEYTVGDPFPRTGRTIDEISKERLEQLTTKNNKKERILIKNIETENEESEEPEEPKAEGENEESEETKEPKAEGENEESEETKNEATTKTTRKRN